MYFFIFFGHWAKNIRQFDGSFFVGDDKTPFYVSKGNGKNLAKNIFPLENCFFSLFSDNEQTKFCLLKKNVWRGCQNCNLPAHSNNLMTNTFFKKSDFCTSIPDIEQKKSNPVFFWKIVGGVFNTTFFVSKGTFWLLFFIVNFLIFKSFSNTERKISSNLSKILSALL